MSEGSSIIQTNLVHSRLGSPASKIVTIWATNSWGWAWQLILVVYMYEVRQELPLLCNKIPQNQQTGGGRVYTGILTPATEIKQTTWVKQCLLKFLSGTAKHSHFQQAVSLLVGMYWEILGLKQKPTLLLTLASSRSKVRKLWPDLVFWFCTVISTSFDYFHRIFISHCRLQRLLVRVSKWTKQSFAL